MAKVLQRAWESIRPKSARVGDHRPQGGGLLWFWGHPMSLAVLGPEGTVRSAGAPRSEDAFS